MGGAIGKPISAVSDTQTIDFKQSCENLFKLKLKVGNLQEKKGGKVVYKTTASGDSSSTVQTLRVFSENPPPQKIKIHDKLNALFIFLVEHQNILKQIFTTGSDNSNKNFVGFYEHLNDLWSEIDVQVKIQRDEKTKSLLIARNTVYIEKISGSTFSKITKTIELRSGKSRSYTHLSDDPVINILCDFVEYSNVLYHKMASIQTDPDQDRSVAMDKEDEASSQREKSASGQSDVPSSPGATSRRDTRGHDKRKTGSKYEGVNQEKQNVGLPAVNSESTGSGKGKDKKEEVKGNERNERAAARKNDSKTPDTYGKGRGKKGGAKLTTPSHHDGRHSANSNTSEQTKVSGQSDVNPGEAHGGGKDDDSNVTLEEKIRLLKKKVKKHEKAQEEWYELEIELKEKADKYERKFNASQKRVQPLESLSETLHETHTAKIVQLEDENKRMTGETTQLMKDLQRTRSELADMTNRLASEMNQRISANESDLENISIKCRPMNIAEDYNVFVSDPWLEAKQVLDDKKVSDKQSIRFLCDILMIANECATHFHARATKSFTKAFLSTIEDPFLAGKAVKTDKKAKDANTEEIPIEALIVFGDRLRHRAGEIDVKPLKEAISNTILERHPTFKKCLKSIDTYVKESARLSWKMVIQRPPMRFEQPDVGKAFLGEKVHPLAWGSKPGKGATIQYYQHPTLLHNDTVMVRGKVLVE